MPKNSPYAAALEYVKKILPTLESLIVASEDSLRSLIDRLSKMGLADSVQSWLEVYLIFIFIFLFHIVCILRYTVCIHILIHTMII